MPPNPDLILVDPLAALFRTDLASGAPLTLEATLVEVDLAPPLAHVAVTRRFRNDSDRSIEAILTLPPAAEHEIVYGLAVTLDGVEHRAQALAARGATRTYDQALAQGRLAVLHEVLAGGVQLVSIAGVAPGVRVGLRVDSVRPLADLDQAIATLTVDLTGDPARLNRPLSDAEALTLTAVRHEASLVVTGDGLRVFHEGADVPFLTPVPIDCAAAVALRIAALGDRRLTRTEHGIAEPGGWEAAVVPSRAELASAFRPAGAPPDLFARRKDWIVGRIEMAGIAVRIVAPARAGTDEPGAALQRAMTAIAVANLERSAPRVDIKPLRLTANLLAPGSSLVFVGSAGEASDTFPLLRKVALPVQELDRAGPPDRPEQPTGHASARAPNRSWIAWSLAVLLALWAAAIMGVVRVSTLPIVVAIGLLLLFGVASLAPGSDDPARRRLWWLLLLPAPWIAAILLGPFGLVTPTSDLARQSWMLLVQNGALVASLLLPLVLLWPMRGARWFTAAVGALNLLVAVIITSGSTLIIAPGS